MVRYCVAHDFTVVHVQYWRQVALVHADVYLRHVGSPFSVGGLCVEVPFQPVWCSLADLAFVRAVLAAPAHVLQTLFLHEPVDRLVVYGIALVPELGHDAPIAVAAPVLCMHGLDPAALVGIAVGPLAQVVVVCGAG